MLKILTAAALAALIAAPAAAQAPPLELKKGDHVVLVGNTLAERLSQFNHFETLLHTRFPDLQLVVRNLGWSADTITHQPRPLNFGDAAKHLAEQKADVIIAFFGLNESFDGEAGVAQFEKDLEQYLKTHLAARYNGSSPPRLALVSPIAHEKLERLRHVDVDARNRELTRYTEVMARVAGSLGVRFADLLTPTKAMFPSAPSPMTINGIHLNEAGDRAVAPLLFGALGLDVTVIREATGTKLRSLEELRRLVHDKNVDFFQRFRFSNAEYVVGRRVEPFGSVNFPGEMKKLDELVAAKDREIWKRAAGIRGLGFDEGGTMRPSSDFAMRRN